MDSAHWLDDTALMGAVAAGDEAAILRIVADRRVASRSSPTSADIASMYEIGATSVPKDARAAMDWYMRSVNSEGDPQGCLGLARLHLSGTATHKNVPLALEFFRRAFEMGSSEAGIILGILYSRGLHVTKDINAAQHFLEPGASSDYILAMYLLALVHLRRRRVFRAIKLFSASLSTARRLLRDDPHSPKLFGLRPRLELSEGLSTLGRYGAVHRT